MGGKSYHYKKSIYFDRAATLICFYEATSTKTHGPRKQGMCTQREYINTKNKV